MRWKIVSAAAFLGIIGAGARWFIDGAQIFTKTARQITVKDDLFGTESVQWEQGLWIGLDAAGPAAAVLLIICLFGIYKTYRNNRT